MSQEKSTIRILEMNLLSRAISVSSWVCAASAPACVPVCMFVCGCVWLFVCVLVVIPVAHGVSVSLNYCMSAEVVMRCYVVKLL